MKCFLVYYEAGYMDFYREEVLFVTFEEGKAKLFVQKFNSKLASWKQYYSQFEDEDGFLKEEFWSSHEVIFRRWHKITDINQAVYKEVKVK